MPAPRSTSERFWKQIVDEGRYFKKGIFTYADIKRKISQKEYENENAEQLFIDDMTRIYEDCMEYLKDYDVIDSYLHSVDIAISA